ncbi:MAG: hypothetical protein ABWX62_06455, partial [Microterricola sp.]
PPTPVLRQFTLISIAVVIGVVSVLAVLLGNAILPGPTLFLAGALSVGVVGYLLVAVLSGVLYGLRLWSAIAWLMILDAGIRAALVIIGLALGWSPGWIAVAISIPFGLAFLAMWARTRSAVVGAFRLDVRLRRLLANASGTVAAAAAMGVMMNGLPMLLGLTAHGSEEAVLAGLILAITLTRAPIVVPLLALQSYLISIFRGGGREMLRRILYALLLATAGVLVLTLLAWLIGPWAIQVISGGQFVIEPAMMAAITVSAGLVAMMCVTGPALLSQHRHAPYVSGWVLAALLTVAALVLPLPLAPRLMIALLAPPAIGLIMHIVALVRTPQEAPATAGPS